MKEIRSAPLRYLLALGSFILILAASIGLEKISPFRIDLTAMIIIAMIASAWYLGLGPGLLLAIILELTLDYFTRPSLNFRSGVIIFNRMVLFTSVVWFASSRRTAQQRLQQQTESLRVTLASIGDAVIATNIDGLITFVNPVAEQITGWTTAEAATKPIHEVFKIINEESRARVNNPFETIKEKGQIVGLANHTVLITRDGREVPIEDSGAPIKDPKGKILGVIIVFHDVSARRREEREREDLLAREQSARKAAETSDRLKDEFLATVSHELRTPLNAILGWAATLALRGHDEQMISRGLTTIQRNAKAQAQLISDILDVSRIVTGKLRLEFRPVELASILRSAVETLSPTAATKSINVKVTVEDEKTLVAGDPERLQQIIWNLVANAIKFSGKDGKIDIQLRRIDSQLELTVRDTGVGISSEFLPHVFERFRQADSSTTRAHGGLGLGLSIVKHMVEQHGGQVSAESEGPGHGSTFKVNLPVASAVIGKTSAEIVMKLRELKSVEDAAVTKQDLVGLRVLVVDDEPDTLEILAIMLNQSGASVRTATSSVDALRTFGEWRPNVLLSDLGMPGEDGFTLINRIRSLAPEQGGNVPAAAITAHAREEDRAKVLAAGYQAHIAKPVDPKSLIAALVGLSGRN
ncbi:MAG TPA: ATP-binding protein [Pyrinomonadaceae bacterium]|nr:ATP-binding protein [Pyrinomonadaceae bacterium]